MLWCLCLLVLSENCSQLSASLCLAALSTTLQMRDYSTPAVLDNLVSVAHFQNRNPQGIYSSELDDSLKLSRVWMFKFKDKILHV
ncbi:hypothetical protein ACET3Z_013969 [Daucus carota]